MNIDPEEWMYVRGQVNGLTVALADKTSQLDELERIIIERLDQLSASVVDLVISQRPRPPRRTHSGRPPELTVVRDIS